MFLKRYIETESHISIPTNSHTLVMAPTTQKAFILDAKLGNYNLGTVPVPKPGSGEILIKTKSVALNPVDWMIQRYGVLVDKYPAILGLDIAGDVEEIGEGVTEFQKGDRV